MLEITNISKRPLISIIITLSVYIIAGSGASLHSEETEIYPRGLSYDKCFSDAFNEIVHLNLSQKNTLFSAKIYGNHSEAFLLIYQRLLNNHTFDIIIQVIRK